MWNHNDDPEDSWCCMLPATGRETNKRRQTEIAIPTYLISVLTLETSISYSFLTAALIWGLFARMSTINTRVLLSSIFFMADSVVRGCLMMAKWSSLLILGADRRGYFGFRVRLRVLGRWNCTDVRTFLFAVLWTPLSTDFLAFCALLVSEALAVLAFAFPEGKKVIIISIYFWQSNAVFTRDTFTRGKCHFTVENVTQYDRNVNLPRVNVSCVNTA